MATEGKGRVAITGATGFLGSHLTERLLKDGYEVSILARDEEKARKFEGRVHDIVIADIADRAAMARLVEGADFVIHLVSNFRTASGSPESYQQINVEGTKAVVDAAMAAGVKRFVHCATIGVHGNVKSTPADENSPYAPGDLYQETKLEAQQYVESVIGKSAMEVVIIRPCSMYGPGDMRMLKMFRMLAKKTFLMIGPCQENFHAVYIDDIVEGFTLAMTTENIAGETFLIGGDHYLPLRDYIKVVADAENAPMPWLKFPYWFFYSAAVVVESICVPLKIEPPLHRRRVRFYKNNRAFNIQKAREKLGYSPKVSLEDGMKRTVAWYKENGFL
ncbi:MAG: NAD-dependent epimerase/dehydratase family protein [Gammaproteobacteria bacterium]|nr:NAD-dependent epimerase/dehydratase family protein [Gammaproteobacteria bacterium]